MQAFTLTCRVYRRPAPAGAVQTTRRGNAVASRLLHLQPASPHVFLRTNDATFTVVKRASDQAAQAPWHCRGE
jgi:hypothetical protein